MNKEATSFASSPRRRQRASSSQVGISETEDACGETTERLTIEHGLAILSGKSSWGHLDQGSVADSSWANTDLESLVDRTSTPSPRATKRHHSVKEQRDSLRHGKQTNARRIQSLPAMSSDNFKPGFDHSLKNSEQQAFEEKRVGGGNGVKSISRSKSLKVRSSFGGKPSPRLFSRKSSNESDKSGSSGTPTQRNRKTSSSSRDPMVDHLALPPGSPSTFRVPRKAASFHGSSLSSASYSGQPPKKALLRRSRSKLGRVSSGSDALSSRRSPETIGRSSSNQLNNSFSSMLALASLLDDAVKMVETESSGGGTSSQQSSPRSTPRGNSRKAVTNPSYGTHPATKEQTTQLHNTGIPVNPPLVDDNGESPRTPIPAPGGGPRAKWLLSTSSGNGKKKSFRLPRSFRGRKSLQDHHRDAPSG